MNAITTEEAERLARLSSFADHLQTLQYKEMRQLITDLAAERDALRAEVERRGTVCDNYFRQVSLMQMRHARHLLLLETRIARQRRALAKLYQRRNDKNTRLSGFLTGMTAALATARKDALEELERHFKEAAAGTPLGHEDRQRGASTYNWLMYCVSTISALKGEGNE
ncbi:MAG: hypothetical protein ACK5VI_09495 [Opitutia bacterium]